MKLNHLEVKQSDEANAVDHLSLSRKAPLANIQGTQIEFCLFEMGCGIYIGGRDWL